MAILNIESVRRYLKNGSQDGAQDLRELKELFLETERARQATKNLELEEIKILLSQFSTSFYKPKGAR